MATPIQPISLADIQTEFGGGGEIGLNEYYAGGAYVPNPAPTSAYQLAGLGQSSAIVPTGGTISIGNFRGLSKIIYDFYDNAATSRGAGWNFASFQPFSD